MCFKIFRPYELLALDFYGSLRSYQISPTEGYRPYHTFSFGNDISAATYVPSYNMLITAFTNSNSLKQVLNYVYFWFCQPWICINIGEVDKLFMD